MGESLSINQFDKVIVLRVSPGHKDFAFTPGNLMLLKTSYFQDISSQRTYPAIPLLHIDACGIVYIFVPLQAAILAFNDYRSLHHLISCLSIWLIHLRSFLWILFLKFARSSVLRSIKEKGIFDFLST